MLILARRAGESVVINDTIEVKVVAIKKDGSVQLGFIAPREIPIYRKELLEQTEQKAEGGSES